MEYYYKETASYNIKLAEKVYQIYNATLFNNELRSVILCENRQRSLDSIHIKEDLILGNDQRYIIQLPLKTLCCDSKKIPIWILAQMVLIDGQMHNMKLTSNHGIYKNERFKEHSEKCGLLVDSHPKYGYKPIAMTDANKKLIEDIVFKDIPYYVPQNSNKRNSSSITLVSNNGNSVRVTKPNHILFCLTDYPEETIKKVDAFMTTLGISRMKEMYT